MILRLDKLLADAGLGTRTEVKQIIKKHNVMLNDAKVVRPETKVDTEKDILTIDGKSILHEEFEYFILNKPAGIISAAEDRKEKTVVDLIQDKKRRDLFPVGRLDRDTEGLLIITNDGKMANRLLKPGKHVDKTYYAIVKGSLDKSLIKKFKDGIDIGDETLTKEADLVIVDSDPDILNESGRIDADRIDVDKAEAGRINTDRLDVDRAYLDAVHYFEKKGLVLENHLLGDKKVTEVVVTIREGRFHQVKRMFEAVGSEVYYLKRISMGLLKLPDDLLVGQYRKLTDEELELLR